MDLGVTTIAERLFAIRHLQNGLSLSVTHLNIRGKNDGRFALFTLLVTCCMVTGTHGQLC